MSARHYNCQLPAALGEIYLVLVERPDGVWTPHDWKASHADASALVASLTLQGIRARLQVKLIAKREAPS